MHRRIAELVAVVLALSLFGCITQVAEPIAAPPAQDQFTPEFVQDLYEKVKPSLVLVQYTYAGELGKLEIVSQGIVVGADGLIMASIVMVPPQLPDAQLTEFKIVIPGDEEKEYEATFEGRDERSNVAFFRTKEKQQWPAIEFQDLSVNVGDPLVSIGLLPKSAGYHPWVSEPTVSAVLRGPVPEVLVSAEGLTSVGSPVFNQQGVAIGLVNDNNSSWQLSGNDTSTVVQAAARAYIPARDFLQSISDPPSAGHPLQLPWMGLAQLSGLSKDAAEFMNLKGQPTVQVGDVIPGTAAEKAGFKPGDIIVQLNGQTLERGDEPDEASQILRRQVQRLKVGTQITFTVLRRHEDTADPSSSDKEPLLRPVTLTLTLLERPPGANLAKRFYAEDTGFAVRDLVFEDRYERKLAPNFKGVIVAVIKPSSAAANAGLETQRLNRQQQRVREDLITQINGQSFADVTEFEKLYNDFRKKSPKEAVILEILRGVRTETIRIEPPQ